MNIVDFGCSDFKEILELQRKCLDELLQAKSLGISDRKETLLLGEHYPVITCGRHARQENILQSLDSLTNRNINVYNIERGGDVTFHGPGQMIAYPIIDMALHRLGVKKYVALLEETVIRLLSLYGLKGERIEGATGVWLGKGSADERKICAIGIKCRNFCTMHGLALNVNTHLDGFTLINPCGFRDKGVTSMRKELGKEINFEQVKQEFSDIFLGLILSL